MKKVKSLAVWLFCIFIFVYSSVFCSDRLPIFISSENISIISPSIRLSPQNYSVAHELTPLIRIVPSYVQDNYFVTSSLGSSQRFDRPHLQRSSSSSSSSFREFAGPRAGLGYKAAFQSCQNDPEGSRDCLFAMQSSACILAACCLKMSCCCPC